MSSITALEEFMSHPLVVWVTTFKDGSLDYMDLVDGIFLNDVMNQIDPRPNALKVNREVNGEVNLRIQNLDTLLKNIKAFYLDILDQLLVMKLPNVLTLSKDPMSEDAINEMQKLLLLMLGCAVQSSQKEVFIERIKQLEIDVQHAIVVHIQEITDNSENVVNLQFGELIEQDQQESLSKNMFNHVKRLVMERDDYAETIMELSQEKEIYQATIEGRRVVPSPTSPGSDRRHITVELAETKAKLRRTRQELEEKNEMALEYKEEIDKYNVTVQKLRQENLELSQDARSARSYRDELDVWKEKASKVEKYEKEIARYREKLNELEYLKRRVEELREDNQLLHETRGLLEDQLEAAHHKVEKGREAEGDCLRLRAQLEAMEEEKDFDRKKIQELVAEVSKLQLDHKQSLDESASLGVELEKAKSSLSPLGNSLSAECNESASSRILRLERENQRLLQEIETMKDAAMLQSNTRILEIEKENNRLSRKVEMLQQASNTDIQNSLELEQEINKLKREKQQLDETINTVRENAERQSKEWSMEKGQLEETVEKLRERNKKDIDQRVKDVEKENKKLVEEMQESQIQISKLEYENKQLDRCQEKLKENLIRVETLEKQNTELDSEKDKMNRNIQTLTLMCEKYDEVEKANSALQIEKQKLERSVETLRINCQKLEQVETENVKMNAETQKMKRSLDTMRNATSRVTELEGEKEELDRRNRLLQKSLDALKPTQDKATHLEVDNLRLETEKRRLENSVQQVKSKTEKLEKENQELENEIEQLKKNLDAASLIAKRVEELETEQKVSTTEKSGLEKERSQLSKENKRLRQSLESRERLVDEANARAQGLDQENRQLQKAINKNKEASERLKELEKDNKEYLKHATIDKKTLATLREELVNEKIKGQQLTNDLEKLATELDKIGLDKNKLLHQEVLEDETRYKLLQNKMEDAVQKNMQIKEERITALETRLKDSVSQNQQLTEELKGTKRVYEVLQQRHDEEKTMSSPGDSKVKRTDSDRLHSKQIMQMKDHLVELERTNATLLAENNSLKSQLQSLQNQVETLRSENKALQAKVESIHEKHIFMQSQQAKLQVENSTLQSHNASLQSQYTVMQSKLTSQEADYDKVKDRLGELLSNYEALLGDHETLVQLHDTLSSEYEALTSEHKSLKSLHRGMKGEMKDLRNRCQDADMKSKEFDKMQTSMREEEKKIKRMRTDNLSMGSLQLEYNTLSHAHVRLNQEYKEGDEELKKLKSQHRNLQLDYTSLQGYLNEMKDQCTSAEMESAKMQHRCEMLNQINGKLEEENQKLMEQLSQLLAQNSEMLVDALETKEYHHEEQHQLEEQLHGLRRQKEKLEEKIMDQYKNYSPPKRSKGLNLNFMKKIYRRGRSSDRDRRKKPQEMTPETTTDGLSGPEKDSLGETSSAGSGIDSLDGSGAGKDERRGSDDNYYIQHRRRDNAGLPSHYRKSMPSHVLEAHEDSNLPGKGVYSMSVEDLRRTKTNRSHSISSVEPRYTPKKVRRRSMYDYDQPVGFSPMAYGHRLLSSESEEGELPPISPTSTSPKVHSPKFAPQLSPVFAHQPSGDPPQTGDDNNTSCDEDSLRDSPRGSPRDGLPPSGRPRRSAMLSRIKSRSREILDDMKLYGSTPNLARDFSFSEEQDSPRSVDADSPRSDKYDRNANGEDSTRLPLPDAIPSTSPLGKKETEDVITPMRRGADLHSLPPSTLDRKRSQTGDVDRKRQHRYSMPEPPKLVMLAQEFNSTPPPVPVKSSKAAPLSSPIYSARPYPGSKTEHSAESTPVPPPRSLAGSHKLVKPKAQYPTEASPMPSTTDSTSKDYLTTSTPEPRYRSSSTRSPEEKPNKQPPTAVVSPNSNSNSNNTSLGWAIPSFDKEETRDRSASEPAKSKSKNGSPTKTEGEEVEEEGPDGETKGGKKKSSVWYEYGCV
ncbi:girdin-like isoform X2 [Asterias rubens]|uniref:girdin-like isoform X2 n=1 Tax=Asterias rubens TaxID=7604 RepID=UPI001454EA1D|nr:girdin-like isoform X2 [Asterias rubens]